MYSRILLMVVCWRYGMPFDANGCVSTLVNVDRIKWMYFCVNEFEVVSGISLDWLRTIDICVCPSKSGCAPVYECFQSLEEKDHWSIYKHIVYIYVHVHSLHLLTRHIFTYRYKYRNWYGSDIGKNIWREVVTDVDTGILICIYRYVVYIAHIIDTLV